ncbi:hypothetical protein CROQUDRAFT_212361 [Cronartium quercuum f. sp. fusiforme G11]|uniref:Uncharacterized protein n=1 Tax=Cronartium quercuum f. sp. fusiforme G11 TaxID=708437 RepID=A0A9P6NVH5_9BASI|nr:hypothetical protein CROQUDRAFT_212361 [Cronartium quercuum f. sp. fusiforme G11]
MFSRGTIRCKLITFLPINLYTKFGMKHNRILESAEHRASCEEQLHLGCVSTPDDDHILVKNCPIHSCLIVPPLSFSCGNNCHHRSIWRLVLSLCVWMNISASDLYA